MGDDAFNKLTNTPTFTNVQQVIVRDIMTSDAKELFLIYDNKDQTVNRIIGFCSPLGLRMLSESNFHHSDGTFHTKAKYHWPTLCISCLVSKWFPNMIKTKKNYDKIISNERFHVHGYT